MKKEPNKSPEPSLARLRYPTFFISHQHLNATGLSAAMVQATLFVSMMRRVVRLCISTTTIALREFLWPHPFSRWLNVFCSCVRSLTMPVVTQRWLRAILTTGEPHNAVTAISPNHENRATPTSERLPKFDNRGITQI